MINKKWEIYNTMNQDDRYHPVKGEKIKSNSENANFRKVNGIFSEKARWT